MGAFIEWYILYPIECLFYLLTTTPKQRKLRRWIRDSISEFNNKYPHYDKDKNVIEDIWEEMVRVKRGSYISLIDFYELVKENGFDDAHDLYSRFNHKSKKQNECNLDDWIEKSISEYRIYHPSYEKDSHTIEWLWRKMIYKTKEPFISLIDYYLYVKKHGFNKATNLYFVYHGN